jgi:hypothetical protein
MQVKKQKLLVRFLLPWSVAFSVMAITVLALSRAGPAAAATGTNQQINYQARLLTSAGAVVVDGSYNMKFKIYQDGNGVLGGGDETLKWTETRIGANKVTVKNGYFTVYLGSVTSFASSIDWDQDTLWLSVDVGGIVSPNFDGEMSPYTRLSSTPYAINSAQLGGLDKTKFVQLAQGVQADSSTTNASIFVNKTGIAANVLQLQRDGNDIFVLSNNGAAQLLTTSDSTAALDVKNSSADSLLTISTDPSAAVLSITSTAGSSQVVLVVDSSDSTGNIVEFKDNGTNVLVIQNGSIVDLDGSLDLDGSTADITAATTIIGTTNINVGGTNSTRIGNDSSTFQLDSSGLDVSTAGALAGVTTFTASGNLDTTAGAVLTNSIIRLTNSGTLQNIAGLTLTGTTSLTGASNLLGGAVSINASSNNATNINTGTSTGAITLGNALATLGITSSAFTVSTAGAVSGISTLAASGNISTSTGDILTNATARLTNAGALQNITALTLSGTSTLTGATDLLGGAVSINASSNNATNINTGTSTGTTTIGNTASTLVLSSTAFKVSSIGAVSGVTTIGASDTISTSGDVNVTGGGVYQLGGVSGETFTCGNNTYVNQATFQGGIITGHSACSAQGLSDERLKINVQELSSSILSTISDVATYSFDYDCTNSYFENSHSYCDESFQAGVLAQQLAEVFPELTYIDDYGYYHVKYDALAVYNLKAVSEIAKILNILDDRTVVSTGGTTGFSIIDENENELFEVDSNGNAYISGSLTLGDESQWTALINSNIQTFLNNDLTINGLVAFNNNVYFNALVAFDKEATFKDDVFLLGRAIFNSDSGGFATIVAGDTEVEILFETPYEETPVVNVSNADGQFFNYAYKDLTTDGFTIILQIPILTDINFSWTAAAIDQAQVQISVSGQP